MLPDSEGAWLVVIGVTFIVVGGLVMLLSKVWHDNYEAGGHDANHRRPRVLEPWHVEPSGENVIVTERPRPKHQLNGGPDEGTRRLMPVTNAARSRVVLIGPEGIEDGNHAGTSGRVRQSQKEDEQEEGSEDRECRQDEGRPLEDGEEGGAYPEAARPVGVERWFRNTVTGEYIFVDRYGRRVDFDA